jgi:hypothetical protein
VWAHLTSAGGSDEELYDVTRDPAQARDRSAERPDLVGRLRRALAGHLGQEP